MSRYGDWRARRRIERTPLEVRTGARGTHCFPEAGLPDGFVPPSAALAARPVVTFTGLTIEYDRKNGQPRNVILNRSDTRTEYYAITDYSGCGLGQDVRYYELGSRIITEPRCGPEEVAAAVRAARGGDPPSQIQGYA